MAGTLYSCSRAYRHLTEKETRNAGTATLSQQNLQLLANEGDFSITAHKKKVSTQEDENKVGLWNKPKEDIFTVKPKKEEK